MTVAQVRPQFWGKPITDPAAQDGHRLNPRRPMLGDDSTPCRWWHPDMGPYCARCGSLRSDLHDGWWASPGGPFANDGGGPMPWNDAERARLGLPLAELWWHQAAGLS